MILSRGATATAARLARDLGNILLEERATRRSTTS